MSNSRSMPTLQVYDPVQKKLTEEIVFKGSFLLFFYGNPLGRIITWFFYKRLYYSRLYGLFQRTARSRLKVASFVERYGVATAELERPLTEYRSFNDFFIRKLRPGARPIDEDPSVLVAPCDGRLLAYHLQRDTAVPVKGRSFTVPELFAGDPRALQYRDGTCLVFRIAPADCHRFYYIDEGRHGAITSLGCMLHSVHPFCLSRGAPVFCDNYRQYCVLRTSSFGDVIHIDVGAMRVGKIVQHKIAGGSFRRGEEKGWFEFGASTVILLFKPGVVNIDEEIVHYSERGIETLVRLGARIGCRA